MGARYIKADMSVGDDCRALVEKAGGCDILVNNAGIQHVAPVEEFPVEKWNAILAINLSSAFHTSAAALPGMRERGWGRILTIGSINQTRPDPELAIYAALKSAQHNLALNLARQLAPFGVTVNNLSPGLVATARNQWRRVDQKQWQSITHDANPMHRAGTPEEMTGAALLLCSDAGSFITGNDLQATGGAQL